MLCRMIGEGDCTKDNYQLALALKMYGYLKLKILELVHKDFCSSIGTDPTFYVVQRRGSCCRKVQSIAHRSILLPAFYRVLTLS